MNITHVPQALQKGAKIYTSTRAVKVETKYGRARAVRGTFKAPGGPALLAIAKRGVVVAASAVQTPGVIRRSGVRLKALGKHFQAHTGTTLTARFDRNVSMQNGATQGFNSTHFVDSNQFKIESLSLPPELISMRIPGVGPELVRNLFDYKHAINWALVVRAEAEGHIGSLFGKDMVHFTPTITDIARVRRGLKIMSEMMFAAGAKEVWPGIHGMKMMTSPNDLRHWDEATLDPKAYSMMLSHMFGSTRMGPDARTSVVGLDFQVHGVRGMYVLDSSIFPTNIGVNPQHTIMAVSRLGATRIVEKPLPALS
jgi:choline dehydrogenase-like flavoprotein